MKVVSITVQNHYGDPSASVCLYDEKATVNLTLTPEESHELLSVGLRIFERRQLEIAQSIADMKPAALLAPGVTDGEFTEVPDDVTY
jgi:hypothetical protein